MISLTFELNWLPPAEVRGNSRAHWAKKHRYSQRLRRSGFMHAVSKEEGETPLIAKASIQFAFRHWRKIDLDNLAIGMKPWVDGLVDAGLLIDDDPDHLTYGEPTFTKVKRGEEGVTVRLWETTNDD